MFRNSNEKDKKTARKMYNNSFLESDKSKAINIPGTADDIRVSHGESIYSQNNMKINP